MYCSRPGRPGLRRALLGLLAPLSALGAIASCGGGGGGGALAASAGEVDQGSYSPSSFGYQNPRGPLFHPLGGTTDVLDPLAELALFVTGSSGTASDGRILDDARAGTGTLAGASQLLAAGEVVLRTATGNVDDDGGAELVLLTRTGSQHWLRAVEPAGAGYGVVDSVPLGALAEGSGLALGDVDGDGLDELVVAEPTQVRVFDDRVAGFVPLGGVMHGQGGADEVMPVVVDVDADGRGEIAVGYEIVSVLRLGLFDDALGEAGAFAPLYGPTTIDSTIGGDAAGLVRGGDLDRDGRDELVTGYVEVGNNVLEATLERYDYVAGSGLVRRGRTRVQELLDFPSGLDLEQACDLSLVDRDGDGASEVALVLPSLENFPFHDRELVLRIYRWDADTPWVFVEERTLGEYDDYARPGLCAGDTDSDGDQELYVCTTWGLGTTKHVELKRISWSPAYAVETLAQSSLASPGLPERPMVAAADFDADGFVLRSTGVRRVSLADPIPLVLLSAAPTKAGIGQAYEETSTSYEEELAHGTAIGVTTTSTYTTSGGVSGAFKIFGGSASHTIERSYARNRMTSESVTTVQSFVAGHASDVIVFQGTLYESYEYEVVSGPDPDLIGVYLTLDLPVDAKTYKWTVGKYNDEFGPEHAIGEDLLPHTIGDPTSYRTRAEVEGIVDAHVGWSDPTARTTGEGSSYNGTSVSLEEEVSDTSELSYSVTDEVGFSIAFASGSRSHGLDTTDIYTVTTAHTTTFGATVGDIAGDDWAAWQYDFGMGVYQHGIAAAGETPSAVPLYVVTFWTEPVGTGY